MKKQKSIIVNKPISFHINCKQRLFTGIFSDKSSNNNLSKLKHTKKKTDEPNSGSMYEFNDKKTNKSANPLIPKSSGITSRIQTTNLIKNSANDLSTSGRFTNIHKRQSNSKNNPKNIYPLVSQLKAISQKNLRLGFSAGLSTYTNKYQNQFETDLTLSCNKTEPKSLRSSYFSNSDFKFETPDKTHFKKVDNIVRTLLNKLLKPIALDSYQCISYKVMTKGMLYPLKIKIFTNIKTANFAIAASFSKVPDYKNHDLLKVKGPLLISKEQQAFDKEGVIYLTVFCLEKFCGHIAVGFSGVDYINHFRGEPVTCYEMHNIAKSCMDEVIQDKKYIEDFEGKCAKKSDIAIGDNAKRISQISKKITIKVNSPDNTNKEVIVALDKVAYNEHV